MTSLTKLTLLLALAASLVPVNAAVLPYGSVLEVRLLHKVGSVVSHVGDPVDASLITPFFDHDRLLLPAGATVSGRVEHIDRLGLGLRHTAARLDIHFTQLRLADGTAVPFDRALPGRRNRLPRRR